MTYQPPNKKIDLSEVEEVLPDRFRRYDTYIATLCPFHSDSNPSLMVHLNGYSCLACGARGSVTALIRFYKGGGKVHHKIKAKTEPFVSPFWIWTKYDSLAQAMVKNWRRLQAFPKAGSYLHDRGILPNTINKLGIGFGDGWYSIPRFDPLGNIVGGVARAGMDVSQPLRYVLPKGEKGLYVPSYKRIAKQNFAYVVFGILDAVSLWQLGFPVISTLYGKKIDPTLFDQFRCKLVFLPDFGEESAACTSAAKLGWRGSILHFPYEKFGNSKDVNDCLQVNASLLQETLLLQGLIL